MRALLSKDPTTIKTNPGLQRNELTPGSELREAARRGDTERRREKSWLRVSPSTLPPRLISPPLYQDPLPLCSPPPLLPQHLPNKLHPHSPSASDQHLPSPPPHSSLLPLPLPPSAAPLEPPPFILSNPSSSSASTPSIGRSFGTPAFILSNPSSSSASSTMWPANISATPMPSFTATKPSFGTSISSPAVASTASNPSFPSASAPSLGASFASTRGSSLPSFIVSSFTPSSSASPLASSSPAPSLSFGSSSVLFTSSSSDAAAPAVASSFAAASSSSSSSSAISDPSSASASTQAAAKSTSDGSGATTAHAVSSVIGASSGGLTTSTVTSTTFHAPKPPSEIIGKSVQEAEVAKVVVTQTSLERQRQLELIETHQREHESLKNLTRVVQVDRDTHISVEKWVWTAIHAQVDSLTAKLQELTAQREWCQSLHFELGKSSVAVVYRAEGVTSPVPEPGPVDIPPSVPVLSPSHVILPVDMSTPSPTMSEMLGKHEEKIRAEIQEAIRLLLTVQQDRQQVRAELESQLEAHRRELEASTARIGELTKAMAAQQAELTDRAERVERDAADLRTLLHSSPVSSDMTCELEQAHREARERELELVMARRELEMERERRLDAEQREERRCADLAQAAMVTSSALASRSRSRSRTAAAAVSGAHGRSEAQGEHRTPSKPQERGDAYVASEAFPYRRD